MSESFTVGDVARVKVTFTPVSTGTPTDPTTLTAYWENPSGTVTSKTYAANPDVVVQQSTGVFVFTFALDDDGDWKWHAVGTGTAAGAAQGQFYVAPANLSTA